MNGTRQVPNRLEIFLEKVDALNNTFDSINIYADGLQHQPDIAERPGLSDLMEFQLERIPQILGCITHQLPGPRRLSRSDVMLQESVQIVARTSEAYHNVNSIFEILYGAHSVSNTRMHSLEGRLTELWMEMCNLAELLRTSIEYCDDETQDNFNQMLDLSLGDSESMRDDEE